MIEINTLTTSPADKSFFKKIAYKVLAGEKKKKSNLSIALIGQKRIKALNRKYLKKNRATDVLAFPDKEFGLGEIVICPSEIKKNAKRFNARFKIELARVLIHGILHLLGFNHEKSKKEKEKMEKKQNYYLENIFKSLKF